MFTRAALPQNDLRLGAQIRDAWNQASKLKLPDTYKRSQSIIVSGMGGSTLGAHVLQTVFRDELKKPFHISNDYGLPGYANRDSLVLLCSYSGTTEETISAAKEAKKRKARMVVVTTGGELAAWAKEQRVPTLLLDVAENPSQQPRMAIGYMCISLAGILHTGKFLNFTDRQIRALATHADQQDPDQATELAKHLQHKLILPIAAEHLVGAAHVFNNQVNENAKQLSILQAIPEIDHHFLEGLSFPHAIKKHLIAVLFNSKHYHPRNQARMKLTASLMEKKGIRSITVNILGKNRLEEAWTCIALGAGTSLALANTYRIDPWPVPMVTEFKELMAKF